ncbi:hypothetical protein [Dongia sedimenti]|uniref:Uncharacterized protein n=1 Tax=Dongia sedimenti TaxID=3064282 RepID=A0ABU0YJH7_9PROT|nr:hypothetical protein [Rhodospirillaceae bacterium R-7]
MAEVTTGGIRHDRYFIVGGLAVAVIIGAFAYHNGYFDSTTTTEQTTVPNANGDTTTTTTTTKSTSP